MLHWRLYVPTYYLQLIAAGAARLSAWLAITHCIAPHVHRHTCNPLSFPASNNMPREQTHSSPAPPAGS